MLKAAQNYKDSPRDMEIKMAMPDKLTKWVLTGENRETGKSAIVKSDNYWNFSINNGRCGSSMLRSMLSFAQD